MVRRNGRRGTHRAGRTGRLRASSRGGAVGRHALEHLEARWALHTSVVVAEVMYQPAEASDAELSLLPAAGSADFEFIELLNPSMTETLSLSNLQLAGNVEFTFPRGQLAPGERAVVVADPDAFAARYGEAVSVFGPWQGTLDDDGVYLSLLDDDGHEVVDLQLADSRLWPFSAAGLGASLELVAPRATPSSQLSRPNRWQASLTRLGTPGAVDAPASGVIINEAFPGLDTVSGKTDQVELFHTSSVPVDIGGWQLSNSPTGAVHYTFPAATLMAPGDYLVVSADEFNPTPRQPAAHHFQLDAQHGDQLFLISPDDHGQLVRRESSVQWGPTDGGSWGRESQGAAAWTTLDTATLGAANSTAAIGPALLSELNYHPGEPSPDARTMDPTITADELEYIEVYNPTLQELDLSGWRLDGAVEFQFAPGTTLAAHEAILVVTFDPVRPQSAIRLLAFRQQYELDPSVRLVGPYGGNQPDDFGHVALLQPGTGGDPQHALFYARDQVVYDDLAPWPAGTDGQGGSLARRAADTSGLAASGWLAKAPTPGTVSFAPSPGPLLPDLVIWDDPLLGFNYFDYLDQHPATQRKIMRFSTAVKNAGSGPLTVHGGDVVDGQQHVLQVVTHADGSTSEYVAGSYVFHPTHGHVHFGDYALYRLYEVADDGGLGPQVAGGEKVSFCLIDSVPFDVALDGAPGLPIYSSCERQTQGISIGWADVYASDLDDQWIDVESVPAGRYWLETFVDPFNHLIEQDETNNVLRHQVVLGVPEYPPDSLDADRINELRLGTGDRELSSMSIHQPGDIDTFRWIAPSTGTLEVDLAFDHDQGDIDLYIWGTDLQSQVQLVSATTEEHGERASFPVIAGKSYFIVVKELSGDTNPSYSLTIDGPDIPADRFEPNDSVLQPTHLGSTSQTLSNLTIHGPNDRDFFAWTAPETATLLVDLQFNSAQGNLDLYVHDFVTNEVVSSTSNIGRELVEVEVDAGRTYVIVIRGRDGDMVNSYDLSVDLLNIPLDAYEPNDSQSQPAVWSAGDRDVSDLSIHKPFNRDYYRWQAPADGPVSVDLFFEQSEGDLDLVLWQDGQSLARSVSSTSDEGVTFEALAGRVYVIEVMGKNGATNAHYRLVVDGPSSVPDEYEPNDTLLTAIDLGEGDVEPIQANVHASFNSDFYQWTPGGSGVLILDLFFQHALGDLDVVLWADGTELAAAAGEEDNERLFMYIDAGRSYVIEVRGKEADINPSYELRIDGPELAADSLEPNDTLDSAMDLGIGDIQLEGMNIHEPDNSDFYRWTAQGSGLAAVDLLFSHEAGDLDLALWINGEEVASSDSLDDDERLTFAATLGQQYIIQVRGKDGAVNSQYDLQIDSPPSVEAPRVVSLGIRQASSSALWASPIAGDDLIATIPRPNWQQIQLGFSEGVNVRAEDLQIEGVLQSSYPLSSFDYDDVAHLATWTLTSPPLPTDRLTLTLSDRLVDHSLNALDGDSHGVEFPSGNGLPGGAFVLTVDLTPGDYAPDRQLDDRDIDALGAALRDDDPLADLNDDGRSTTDDILTLVRELLGTTIGDVNLDGRFDSSDLVEMFAAGEFEDMLAGNSTWASGDLNGDGEFDSSDLIFAFQIGGYQS